MFSFILTNENVPQELAAWLTDKGLGQIAFLLAVNVLLLVAGTVFLAASLRRWSGELRAHGGDHR